jgi:WD40 repeat protein
MKNHYFLKAQITILIITLLSGCSPISNRADNDPISPKSTTTSVPDVEPDNTLESASLLHTLSGHTKRILDLAFTSEGKHLVSSSQDMNIKVWDVENAQEVHTFQMTSVDMADIDISSKQPLLASAEAIWDLRSFQEIHVLERGLIYPGTVAFSPEGSTLALGLFEQEITLWNVTTGQPVSSFERQEENRTKRMAFSPDGTSLAVGVIDGTVRLYDLVSGEIEKTLKYSGETDIHDLAYSPDGKYLATGGRMPAVILWDVPRGEVDKVFRLTDNAISMDFSPDGSILATSGGFEYEVRLWDVDSGKLLYALPHSDQLMTVAFSPDGRLLAVGSFDSNVYIWEISAYK